MQKEETKNYPIVVSMKQLPEIVDTYGYTWFVENYYKITDLEKKFKNIGNGQKPNGIAPSYDVSNKDLEAQDARRKGLSSSWQEMVAIQKKLGKSGNIEAAKEMKNIVSEFKKAYLGTCYVIGRICPNYSGDCPWIEIKDIPEEIYEHYDMALNFLDLVSATD